MTSYTRKLYDRTNNVVLRYGKHTQLAQFTLAKKPVPKPFGKRSSPPSALHACKELCGHPACAQGCVLFVQQ